MKHPVVITVHDLIHEKFPNNSYRAKHNAALKCNAILRADHIICVSETTRRDLLSLYNVRDSKVTTVYHGVNMTRSNLEFNSPGPPSILYVGLRSRYKNFSRLLEAYASSKILSSDFVLISFGGKPFTRNERAHIKALGLKDEQVRHVRGDDQMLAYLYSHASVFVYPSLYEGFGIPLLEAMSCGCPVAASRTSAIPEVVGNAAFLFDPYSVEDIRTVIEEVVSNASIRSELIAKGQRRANEFTWDRCAKETLKVYQRLI